MKPQLDKRAEKCRKVHPTFGPTSLGDMHGYFVVGPLLIISSGSPKPEDQWWPWEHVSVSREDRRIPSWDEMSLVKDMFWEYEETCVQFHPRRDDYVNLHPGVLHIWRRVDQPIDLPRKGMV